MLHLYGKANHPEIAIIFGFDVFAHEGLEVVNVHGYSWTQIYTDEHGLIHL